MLKMFYIGRNGIFGLMLVILLASAATLLARLDFFRSIGISSLIIGIFLGIIFGNTLRTYMPVSWQPGIVFSSRIILRLAIILYGFRITFQQIAAVGLPGLVADTVMLTTTFLLGAWVGVKFLKMDEDMAFLTSSGASICGAAAVLATEPVLKSEPYKTSIAVATVVLFGTSAMFLYPVLHKLGIFIFGDNLMGIYIGATVHEVAHVVAAGNAISSETADTAVIVKMTRVMMLVPLLLVLSWYVSKKRPAAAASLSVAATKSKIAIPWFAIGFVIVAGFNSLRLLPSSTVNYINIFDTFLLTMAMTALGIDTNIARFKNTGGKPILLAFLLFLWLIIGGYFLTLLLEKLM